MTSSPKLFNTAMAVYACAACIVSAHASPLQSSRKLLSQQEQETIQETIHLGHALFNSGKLADFEITRSLGLPIIETDSLHINAEELKSAYDKVRPKCFIYFFSPIFCVESRVGLCAMEVCFV